MMKEIKYRAYSKRTKKVYHVLAIFFYQKVVKLSKICGSGISFLEQIDDVVLMQYTGIKDKDGIEIFEGDIVEIQVNDRLDWNAIKGKVVFLEGAWIVEDVGKFVIELWSEANEIEVIGNVYQNKDLI